MFFVKMSQICLIKSKILNCNYVYYDHILDDMIHRKLSPLVFLLTIPKLFDNMHRLFGCDSHHEQRENHRREALRERMLRQAHEDRAHRRVEATSSNHEYGRAGHDHASSRRQATSTPQRLSHGENYHRLHDSPITRRRTVTSRTHQHGLPNVFNSATESTRTSSVSTAFPEEVRFSQSPQHRTAQVISATPGWHQHYWERVMPDIAVSPIPGTRRRRSSTTREDSSRLTYYSRQPSRYVSPALQPYGAESSRHRRTGGGGRYDSRPPQPVGHCPPGWV